MRGLTDRQAKVLEFIRDYSAKHRFPPSIREIGAHMGIGSLRGVSVHLDALEYKGFITRTHNPRSIKIISPEYRAGFTACKEIANEVDCALQLFHKATASGINEDGLRLWHSMVKIRAMANDLSGVLV